MSDDFFDKEDVVETEDSFFDDEDVVESEGDFFADAEPSVEAPIEDPLVSDASLEQAKDALSGGLAGGAAGYSARTALNIADEPTKRFAESMAYSAIGGKKTKKGKDLIKSSLLGEFEQDVASKFTPRDVGRAALDQDIFDVGKAFEASKQANVEVEDLLKTVPGKKSGEDILNRYRELVSQQYKYPETEPAIKSEKRLKKMEKRLTPDITRSPEQLEDIKRDIYKNIDYTKDSNLLNEFKKLEARAYKEGTENLVEQFGGPQLLEAFQDAKTESGKMAVLRDILSEDLIKDYATEKGIKLSDAMAIAYERPDILIGRRVIESPSFKRKLAKTADVVSKVGGASPVKKLAKGLPYIGAALGAGLSFSEAKAEGLDTSEALGRAVEEEGIETVLGPFAPSKIGGLQKDDPARLLESGEITPDEFYRMRQERSQQGEKSKTIGTSLNGSANEISEFQKDPSLITPIIEKMERIGGSQFVGPLQNAMDADPRKRTAIMYGLYQQPAFRKLMEREEKNDLEE